jgi:hypothetical protein
LTELLSHEAHPGGQTGAARQAAQRGEGEVAAAGRRFAAPLLILLLRRPAFLKIYSCIIYLFEGFYVMVNLLNDIFEKVQY